MSPALSGCLLPLCDCANALNADVSMATWWQMTIACLTSAFIIVVKSENLLATAVLVGCLDFVGNICGVGFFV